MYVFASVQNEGFLKRTAFVATICSHEYFFLIAGTVRNFYLLIFPFSTTPI